MPSTQTVEFECVPSQTLTVRLFAAGSDTIVQTASAVTAQTNRTGIYLATFSDVAAGTYRLIATNTAGTKLADWWVDLTLATGTFVAYQMPVTGFGTAVLESRLTALRAGYLDSVVLAANSNRTVQITGSQHIAADVHEFQAGVIAEADFANGAISARVIATGAVDADAIAADAVTEIQVGLALATELAKVPKSGETRRYTQVAANAGNKTADVTIGVPL